MKYQDFILYFEGERDGGHNVVLFESLSGEARGRFTLPFEPRQVDRLLWQLGHVEAWSPVMATTGCGIRHIKPAGRSPQAAWLDPREMGEKLFRALFTGEILRAYENSLTKIKEREDQRLRIQLRFDAADPATVQLHRLPWELMGTARKPALAVSSDLSLVRYLHTGEEARPFPLSSALRILVVISSPADLPALDLEREREWITKAWEGRKQVEITVLDDARLSTLGAALSAEDSHVLHFMGHGEFDHRTGQGTLCFESEAGTVERLTAEDLTIALRDFPTLSLIFLNACQTARATAEDRVNPFAGVATSLVMNGLPAVLAMQFPISDQAATVFSGTFYQHLAAGEPLDAAVAAGRKAIWDHRRDSFEWATPVLFMRVSDGRIFEPQVRRSREQEALLHDYLRWLTASNARLALPGVEGGRRTTVALEAVYVALRGDRSNPYELAQSRLRLEEEARRLENLPDLEQLTPEQKYKLVWRRISLTTRDPWSASHEERDRRQLFSPRERETLNLGDAFRHQRRLVILGDPGSGKTTLVRWLTLWLAKARSRPPAERVHVPRDQVDARCRPGSETIDLGPARVPILIRVASYAEAWKSHRRNLPLISFLGWHSGPDYGPMTVDRDGHPIDPEALGVLLRELVAGGEAVVFLDGLDEITDPGDRRDIVHEIDAFLDDYLDPHDDTAPAETGGTQVLVTSRLVGYHMEPLAHLATHMTIEPMATEAIERFCGVYVRAVHRASRPGDPPWTAADEDVAAREAQGLRQAISNLRRSGADELAGNPLLITILALVYRHHRSGFPRQRVKLYEAAVSILLGKWRRRAPRWPFDDQTLRAVLEPLAAEIHQRSGIGVLDERELEQVLGQRLAEDEVTLFLTVLRQEVGLLAERGERVYGFLHLTFQEYLAACALVRERGRIGEELLARLGDPRWREPILMAFGKLSAELEPAAFERLLLAFLGRDDPLKYLLPRGALLIVAALPEMEEVPARAVEEIAEQLLSTYANPSLRERFPALAAGIEQAFRELCAGGYAAMVDRVLRRALGEPPAVAQDRVSAAASLVGAARRHTVDLAAALSAALPGDSPRWNWPVDRALRDLALHDPDLLPYGRGSLRRTLMRDARLADRFLGAFEWQRLGRVLYGGVDNRLPARIAELETRLARLREESNANNANHLNDPRYDQENSRLTAEIAAGEEQLRRAKAAGNDFAVERFHRESPALTPIVIEALENDLPARSLVPELRRLAEDAEDPAVRLDAWLALAAVGEPITAELRCQDELAETVTAHLTRVKPSLALAVPAAFSAVPVALAQLDSSCSWQHRIDLLGSTIHLARVFGQDLSNPVAIEGGSPPELKPRLLAEIWVYLFGRDNDDALYNAAVTLDTFGAVLAPTPLLLAETLAAVSYSVGAQGAQQVRWPLETLAAHARDELDILTAALDSLATLPDLFDFVRGWALGRLAPLLRSADLLPEAAVIVLGSISERFGARGEAMTELLGSDASWLRLLGSPYPAPELLDVVQALEDPYLRFRGYRRLMKYYPDLRNRLLEVSAAGPDGAPDAPGAGFWRRLCKHLSSDGSLPAQAPDTARQIADPRHRAWAFEQLASLDAARRRQWFARASDAARRIRDRDDRAPALARLAIRFPLEEAGHDLLRQALAAAAAIRGPRRRAETLAALRPALVGYPELGERLENLASGLRDPWHRIRARGFHAPFFERYGTQLAAAGVDLGSLELAAIVSDFEAEFGVPSDLPGLWAVLAGPRRAAALAVLERRTETRGLRLTRDAAAAIERLLQEGETEVVLRLLPRAEKPEPTVSPILEDWLHHGDAEVRAHANLLLAEAEGISERTVPGLLALLADTDDRTRYRSALLLHGDRSTQTRPLDVTRIGPRTLHLLARQYLDRRKTEPAVALVIRWTFERIQHNHGRAFAEWVAELGDDPEGAEEARIILSSISAVHDSLWPMFCHHLDRGTPEVQKALLRSLCYLLARDRISPDQWQQISPVLAGLGPEGAEQEELVLDSPGALVAAVRAAARGGEGEPLAAAQRAYARQRSHLAQVLSQDPETWKETLAAVGSSRLDNDQFRGRILAAAECVEAEPALFDRLTDWLDQRLRQNVQEDIPDSLLLSDLLCVVAAAAERLPNTFYNKVRPMEVLQKKLREAAEWHNSYPGRQAALVLLSYLRTINPRVLAALRAGIRDVIHVQTVALGSVDRYRDVGEDFLRTLFRDLYDPSAAVAFATGQMLAAVARNIHLAPELRQLVVEALATAVDDPRSCRGVYRMIEEWRQDQGNVYRIRYQGQLDALLYESLVKLSGAADLRTRNPAAGSEEEEEEVETT